MNRIKEIATTAVFCLTVFGIAAAHLLIPDGEISTAERRKLEQKPAFNYETVMSGEYSDKIEKYMLDQFPLRDSFRSLKAFMRFNVFRQKDNNGIYVADGQVVKIESKLDESQVEYAADRINTVIDKYLDGSKVYYSIVPDKNAYASVIYNYPHLDYTKLTQIMYENVKGAEYIDLFSKLSLEDYYYTDTHWKQENITDIAQYLADKMGLGESLTPDDGWKKNELSPFYGVYYGQSALNVPPDTITYLTSDATDSATMTGAEFDGEMPVYTTDKFTDADSYDIFTAGPQSVLTIQSPNAKTDKELIIFRDSFGSSISPLFLEGYSKVTLIDLRYIVTDFVGEFVDFHGQDVLFLYSTGLLNSGRLLR